MSKKLLFSALLVLAMPSLANSAVDYTSLCADEAGKKHSEQVNHGIDEMLGEFIRQLDPVLADLSKKQTPAETKAYNDLTALKKNISDARDKNSSDWSSHCF
jgi:hypothetical protein